MPLFAGGGREVGWRVGAGPHGKCGFRPDTVAGAWRAQRVPTVWGLRQLLRAEVGGPTRAWVLREPPVYPELRE